VLPETENEPPGFFKTLIGIAVTLNVADNLL
jgi:hypothetical protein